MDLGVAPNASTRIPASEYSTELSISQLTSSWTSSSTTVPGPGALTGKAIKALGTFTLRGLDRVIIYTRIKSIVSRFPHTDEQAMGIRGIDETYNIILELSRPGLYSEELRTTSLHLILSQIKTGHTSQLVKALGRWHPIELELFLSEIIQSVPPTRASFRHFNCHNSMIFRSLSRQQVASLMSRICQTNKSACKTVVKAHYFDIILSLDEGTLSYSDADDIYRAIFFHVARLPIEPHQIKTRIFDFLLILISSPRPSLMAVLTKWDAWEIRMLIDNVMRHLSPYWHSAESALQGLCTSTNIKHTPDRVLIQCLGSFFYSVACISSAACQTVIQAGLLDMLLAAVENRSFSIVETFEFILALLNDGDVNHRAIDRLVHRVFHGHDNYLQKVFSSWSWEELHELVQLLAGELMLRSIDTSHHQHHPSVRTRRSTACLTSFIIQIAISNDRSCQAVLKTGVLDALVAAQEQKFEVDHSVLDILSRQGPAIKLWVMCHTKRSRRKGLLR